VKSTTVERSGEYLSDQGAVWNEVHKLENRMEVNSPTSAMGDVYDAKSIDLEEFVEAFELELVMLTLAVESAYRTPIMTP